MPGIALTAENKLAHNSSRDKDRKTAKQRRGRNKDKIILHKQKVWKVKNIS